MKEKENGARRARKGAREGGKGGGGDPGISLFPIFARERPAPENTAASAIKTAPDGGLNRYCRVDTSRRRDYLYKKGAFVPSGVATPLSQSGVVKDWTWSRSKARRGATPKGAEREEGKPSR